MATVESRIRWSQDERQAVIKRTRDIFAKGEFTTWIDRIMEAQKVLPINRRKSKTSLSSTIQVDIKAAVLNFIAQDANKTKHSHVVEVSQPVAEIVAHPVTAGLDEEPEPKVHNVFNTLDATLKGLAQNIAKTLERYIADELETVAEKAFITAIASLKMKSESLKTNAVAIAARPRIVICGLKANQAVEIAGEFSDLLDIRFVDASENMSALTSNIGNAHAVVMMTKFISHSHSEAVKKHQNVINVNGGVSALKEKLLEVACNS